MEATTISSKFQVVIPLKIRERYNLKPGYKVVFIPFEGTLRIVLHHRLSKREVCSLKLTPRLTAKKRIANERG